MKRTFLSAGALAFALFGLLGLFATWPIAAYAQLISPGKLASVHQAYEGVGNCTSCHTLGTRGVNPDLCLKCHTTLDSRIKSRTGYHGQLRDLACGTCHKEHFGRDFQIVRFDTTAFDHSEAGYRLTGAHVSTACRTCHAAAMVADPAVIRFSGPAGTLGRTYLGLSRTCSGCHEADNPHGSQFRSAACSDCHDENDWKAIPKFDHKKSRYPLTGRHVDVECTACHRAAQDGAPVVYRGVTFSECSACHSDPHEAKMGAVCATCHSTANWSPSSPARFEGSFNHRQTGFELSGAHAEAECASCHRAGATRSSTVRMVFQSGPAGRRYPVPSHDTCGSCHIDVHAGDLPHRLQTGVCTDCHGDVSWKPSLFGPTRHQAETRFQLEGAHVSVPCVECHRGAAAQGSHLFAVDDRTCVACHAEDDPHGTQFMTDSVPAACTTCHTTQEWTIPDFNHGLTRFALEGKHGAIACGACHKPGDGTVPVSWRGLATTCVSCHADPHAGQFETRACNSCHDTEAFRLASFDHSRTVFPLDGAHAAVACAACHKTEISADGSTFVRFRPLETRCAACHPS